MTLRMPWKTSTTQTSKAGRSDWSTAKTVAEEMEVEETQVGPMQNALKDTDIAWPDVMKT